MRASGDNSTIMSISLSSLSSLREKEPNTQAFSTGFVLKYSRIEFTTLAFIMILFLSTLQRYKQFSIPPNISRIICSYLASLNSIQSPRASLVTWISGRVTFPSSLQSNSENLLSLEKKVMIYGYIRVSSDKQTVENQRFEINNFCKKEKLIINGWIEETIWNHSDRFTGPEE